MDAQHKATLRVSLRSALSHRRLANEMLDGLKLAQDQFNAAMDKLDADTAAALDTDYEATLAISSDDAFEADDNKAGAQHKATLRRSLQSALSHRRLANELADSLEELQTAHNALMVKLDAEAGTLDDTDYEATLSVDVISADTKEAGAQHKATLRRSLRSALAHRRLADQILDSYVELQQALNSALAQIDGGTVNGQMAQFKVTPIEPDQA